MEPTAFSSEQLLKALGNSSISIFRYFPKTKTAEMPENMCRVYGFSPVIEGMPKAFSNSRVVEEDRERFNKCFAAIDEGAETAMAEFRTMRTGTLCGISLTVIKRDEDCRAEECVCVFENRSGSEAREEKIILNAVQEELNDYMNCAVVAFSLPDERPLIVNETARKMLGAERHDGKSVHEMVVSTIVPEDIKIAEKAHGALKKIGDKEKFRFRCELSGEIHTLECVAKLYALDSEKNFVLSVFRDITEEIRTETLLRNERRQFRDALMVNNLYFYIFDVTEGIIYNEFNYSDKIKNAYKALCAEFPMSYNKLTHEWKKRTNPEFLTPEERSFLTSEEILERYKNGETSLTADYYSPEIDLYIRRSILLAPDEETGHITAAVFATDISESVLAETRKSAELALSNRVLQRQVDITRSFASIYFGSWEIDIEEKKLAEISVPDWAGVVVAGTDGDYAKAIDNMVSGFILREHHANMRKFLDISDMSKRLFGQSIISCEYVGMRYGWCSADLIPMKKDYHGHVLKAILALRGISAAKRLEIEAKKALQDAYESANRANLAKTEFLASMSHDIRTPLNAIIGMTAIAGTHLDDKERVSDCLAKITVSGKHLLGLINEVLDMNKIESGKVNLTVEEFNFAELIENLITMAKPLVENKKHKFSVVQKVEHEKVVGDSQRLQQVFMNLLSNSVKYTPESGKIRVTITEKPAGRPKVGFYEVVFEDNGIGMSEEFLATIFEPFSRAEDSRVSKIQGTGLGMPIARNIVRMMNGDITVESKPDKGTKVIVTFFLELQDEEASADYEDLVDLPVLVCDDDESACESTCIVLSELGMNGEWVVTGAEAVKTVTQRHNAGNDFFAVIIDWKMPVMDGVATTREIRRAVGDDVPIIIISAYDWSEIELEARAAGANAFISKPLFKSRVVHLFRTLVGSGDKDPETHSGLDDLAKSDFSGRRVLLVEDNDLNAQIAGEILGMAGLVVEYARDGKEALDTMAAAADDYYDMVFMDIQMPVMNGYEATRAIRSLEREYTKRVPIIAMTANAFAEDVQAAKTAGMNEHIAKPLDFNVLLKTLKKWLKK